LKRDDVLLF